MPMSKSLRLPRSPRRRDETRIGVGRHGARTIAGSARSPASDSTRGSRNSRRRYIEQDQLADGPPRTVGIG